jgi:endonuclease-3
MERLKNKAKKIIEILDQLYPEAVCTLDYKSPLELMVATQLAAQCTDARVNIVTKELFEKYKTVEDYANADIGELEQDIKSTGFYRNKAKNLINAGKMILKDYGGEIPNQIEELIKIPGVGRKTANVVLGTIFKKEAVVIDTHAKRISKKLGLAKEEDPVKIEFELMKILPEDSWTKYGHQLVLHGRQVCKARKPLCEDCQLGILCDYYLKNN